MDGHAVAAIGAQACPDTAEGKYLTFLIHAQMFGVPISDVVQIIGIQQITEFPESPPYVKGIIDLRGEIIPIIDMRLRLGKPEKAYSDRTCIIVMNIRQRLFGFIVDEVDEVASISEDSISPPPQMEADKTAEYLTGVAQSRESIVLLMDPSRLLGIDEWTSLRQAAG